ncbi:hypothetical protein R3P38DRAFT_3076671 [Favolaschia claudopus]|uniref:Uncharacterized protein n=1 Tax=Favolaschia claudopus TaxID=2862362 RepID=A0AAV9ZWM3_9AGAR
MILCPLAAVALHFRLIAPSHLRQHSPSSPSLLVQHLPHDSLSVNNNSLWSPAPELPVTASDSFIPDDDPDSPVEVQATTFRQPTAAFSVAVQPPASRRRAPAPTPAPTPGPASQPPDDTIPDAIEFEVMVWLPAPPEKSAGARKAKKAPKPEQPSFGPITAHTDMDYDVFLEVPAEKLSATPNFLVLSSMEWRYVKPANSVWLPLRDLDGYKSLIKKILKPGKGVSATYIIVRMKNPVKPPATQATPWATQPTATSSRYTGAAEGADEPELSDDEGLPKKKVCLRSIRYVVISPHKISLDLGTNSMRCTASLAEYLLRIICLHSSRATSSRSLAARRRTL